VLVVQPFRPVLLRPVLLRSVLLGPVLVGAATADRFVTVEGIRLHIIDSGGDKPALILLHGIARHAHTFDHIAPQFSRRYRVIAVDMRGHGDSGWSADGAYLVQDYVNDLEGLIDQLRL